MRARATKLSAIGVAVGLLFATTVVGPASAAAPTQTTTTATSGCSSLNGLTVTGSQVSVSNVALAAGDVITVSVSPAREGDRILLRGASGFNWFFADGAPTGFSYRIEASSVYSLNWSLSTSATPPSSMTWSVKASCSSTSIVTEPTVPTKPAKGGGKGKGRG
jgi:hypothetical protein